MNQILKQLQADHWQIMRVLYHLTSEVKNYGGISQSGLKPGGVKHGDQGRDQPIPAKAQLTTIIDILDYIQLYPEVWHHPAEDIILDVLLDKDPNAAEQLAEMIEEHEIFEVLTENLHSYIDQLASGQSEGAWKIKSRFIMAVSDYVSRQLSHMAQEQKLLFPLVEKHLKESDWELIKKRIKQLNTKDDDINDRLNYYQSRYQTITTQSAVIH